MFQIILLATLIIGVLGYFLIRNRHAKSKLREVYKTEFKLSKRIHDEVANDIYQAMAQIESNQSKNSILDVLEGAYLKTRDISRENRIISDQEDFAENLKDLIGSYKTTDTNIILKDLLKIDWKLLSTLKKVTVFRVVQELLTNMKKHSNANLVVFIFEYKHKKIHIKYKDNGRGTTLINKNGLQNAENRMEAIGGKITFDTFPEKGFIATLII